MAQIVTIDPRAIVKASGLTIDLPAYARAAVDDGEVLAVWGLAWGRGRCWLFFHVENYRPGFGLVIRREANRILRHAAQLGETEVFTPRDKQFQTSEKLCKLMGFRFFALEYDEHGREHEVWRWQHYQ